MQNRSQTRVTNTPSKRDNFEKIDIIFITLLTCAAAYPASAQEILPPNPSPPQRVIDANNVDLTSSVVSIPKTLVSGGDPARPLAAVVNIKSTGPDDPPDRLNLEPKDIVLYTGWGRVEINSSPIGNFVFRVPPQWENNPVPLMALGSAGIGVKTSAAFYNRNGDKFTGSSWPNINIINYADGEVWTYYYTLLTYPNGSGSAIKFVVSNRGYGLQFSYDNGGSPTYTGGPLKRVTFYNKAYVYCNEAAGSDCAAVSALNTAGTISNAPPPEGLGSPTYVDNENTDGLGGTTSVPYPIVSATTYAAPGEQGLTVIYGGGADGVHSFTDVVKVETAGIASSARTYRYVHRPGNGDGDLGASGLLSASDGVSTWTYTIPDSVDLNGPPFLPSGGMATDPFGKTYGASAVNLVGTIDTSFDQLGRFWYGGYETINFRQTSIINPELDQVLYTYDSRGNVTEERHQAKTSSNLPDIVRTAAYPSTCSNYVTCNKPMWIKDFKGNQTDFTYDINNGKVLTATSPADANGVRAQKRYTYVQRYAWILSSTGGYVHASSPVWLIADESFCRTSAATGNPSAPCAAGNNDEVKTVYDYGPDSGPNNLFLRGIAVTAETVANGVPTMVTLRTCYGNDANGRRIWVTRPRANLASCS